jgi:hypothetical protein
MQITFILKNLTDAFYHGTESGSIIGLLNMTDAEKFTYLNKKANDKMVSMKIGSGQFRDKVELNQIIHNPSARYSFDLQPRKGYKLAIFNIH